VSIALNNEYATLYKHHLYKCTHHIHLLPMLITYKQIKWSQFQYMYLKVYEWTLKLTQ